MKTFLILLLSSLLLNSTIVNSQICSENPVLGLFEDFIQEYKNFLGEEIQTEFEQSVQLFKNKNPNYQQNLGICGQFNDGESCCNIDFINQVEQIFIAYYKSFEYKNTKLYFILQELEDSVKTCQKHQQNIQQNQRANKNKINSKQNMHFEKQNTQNEEQNQSIQQDSLKDKISDFVTVQKNLKNQLILIQMRFLRGNMCGLCSDPFLWDELYINVDGQIKVLVSEDSYQQYITDIQKITDQIDQGQQEFLLYLDNYQQYLEQGQCLKVKNLIQTLLEKQILEPNCDGLQIFGHGCISNILDDIFISLNDILYDENMYEGEEIFEGEEVFEGEEIFEGEEFQAYEGEDVNDEQDEILDGEQGEILDGELVVEEDQVIDGEYILNDDQIDLIDQIEQDNNQRRLLQEVQTNNQQIMISQQGGLNAYIMNEEIENYILGFPSVQNNNDNNQQPQDTQIPLVQEQDNQNNDNTQATVNENNQENQIIQEKQKLEIQNQNALFSQFLSVVFILAVSLLGYILYKKFKANQLNQQMSNALDDFSESNIKKNQFKDIESKEQEQLMNKNNKKNKKSKKSKHSQKNQQMNNNSDSLELSLIPMERGLSYMSDSD
ncbi:hypothetical protein PPERSA_02842 [Pseudocohnilembus persalinus]|uniref:Transmembrane protein n=1 Tax=Pseudocohnilembus persalinus TaxID=266149 RepID=A0A0V0QMT5_PSEPJ|nr:hypothetical protein PPERSA_02842 [Pseudocohnilembus persalinus]|eukprot:KRX03463.1 hypothetical protein PPERSA_02842 [Pseudocohnilembus persalinus]